MKKLIFTFAIALYGLTISAQDFNGGIKAGFTASQISGDQISGFDKAGPAIGGWVNYYFTKKDVFQFELFYAQKGSRKNDTNEDPTKYLLRLHYVEAPFMYRRYFSKKISGEGGPSIGVLFNHQEKDENGEWPFANREKFKLMDVSIAYGFKYDFTDRIRGSVRFQQSVLPVRDHPGGGVYRLDRGQYNFVFINTIEVKL